MRAGTLALEVNFIIIIIIIIIIIVKQEYE